MGWHQARTGSGVSVDWVCSKNLKPCIWSSCNAPMRRQRPTLLASGTRPSTPTQLRLGKVKKRKRKVGKHSLISIFSSLRSQCPHSKALAAGSTVGSRSRCKSQGLLSGWPSVGTKESAPVPADYFSITDAPLLNAHKPKVGAISLL
jgi:hypothetical protein